MPVRSSAQCRPAIPQRASAIWITDSMLRQAIEHYHRQFAAPASCRLLSSHSGPLESRRRQLGKRNMTGIMPSSSTYTPLWHFDVAWIPSEWKWEPPTTVEERKKKKQAINPSALFDGLISWLEKSDGDRPFIQPPADVAVSNMSSMSAGEAAAAVEPPYHDGPIPTELPQELVVLRASIATLETINSEALDRLRKGFRRNYLRRMEKVPISVEGLRLAMEPLDRATRDKLSDPKLADWLFGRIRRSLLAGLNAAQKKNSDQAAVRELWLAFATIICSSGGSYQNVRLFNRMLSLMPDSIKIHIPTDQIFNLARSFIVTQATSSNLSASWKATAVQFGQALSMLHPTQLQSLDDDIHTFLSQQEMGQERERRLLFSWLLAEAYNPATTNQEFVQSYQRLTASHEIDLRHLQLWQLVVARLKATGAIDGNLHTEITRIEYSSLSQRWAALFSAIHSLPNASSILTELFNFFKGINQTDALPSALPSLPISRTSVDCVRTIATACDDHRLALQLYEALRSRLGQGEQLTAWGWEAWVPYLERIIKDPEITRPVHWEMLKLSRLAATAQRTTPDPEEIAREIQAKMALLDKMGQWYMEASHLNDRQVLRRLQRCASVQRALTRNVSSQVLAQVTEVVTRDLQRGQWGRTTWLQWLLGMVAQKHGDEHASDVLKTIKGWRWMIDRHQGPAATANTTTAPEHEPRDA
ncbi:hypothetical protein TRIATDRAFT_314866 [Trichoderma atroviride IMI 206040]|uniref:Uncharacterized protein n=1 Tax=Hypocrea atroviridis (strain ATCC 20476 / IMI 206040) TaxID=452589 RepID=G9NHD6_HYPAI|nr:uncharacterized protein TRIATDRAFT_314866 [Trichoderma atroviride IMI 206040]EHK50030.1 hypothetical protein TRIATDRAFT_314866 [Trichoderma atroviride IMI 206040]